MSVGTEGSEPHRRAVHSKGSKMVDFKRPAMRNEILKRVA